MTPSLIAIIQHTSTRTLSLEGSRLEGERRPRGTLDLLYCLKIWVWQLFNHLPHSPKNTRSVRQSCRWCTEIRHHRGKRDTTIIVCSLHLAKAALVIPNKTQLKQNGCFRT